MNRVQDVIVGPRPSVLATNKVIRNTYMLLSLTLLFSAAMATVSMVLRVPPATSLVSTLVAFGLIWFALPRTANSSAGLGVVFAITGLLGFGLGPMLNVYASLPSGPQIIAVAFGGTGTIFLGLSGYALTTRRDFSFLGASVVTGLLLVLVLAVVNIFLNIPALSLGLSAMIILVMSGFILYDTSRIISGAETNYIRATVGMYLSIFNIFVSLLQLLGFASDD